MSWKHFFAGGGKWTLGRSRSRGRAMWLAVGMGLLAPVWGRAQISIPLHVVNIGTESAPQYKLGIYVGLGGGTPKLYEFDTGAAGLFAAYNATTTPWWGSFTSTGQPLTMSYASGIQYEATIVSTEVRLHASAGGPALASVLAEVGQIEQATGSTVANWNTDLADGKAPLYGHFYGDFGMALYRNEGNTPVPPIPDPDTNPSLYAILPQLGAHTGPLGNGFIISLGSYANPTPTLQIGLTADDRARFSSFVAMNAPTAPTAAGTFPFGGGPTYSQQLLNGTLTLNQGDPSETVNTLGAVLDTGAPSTVLHNYGTITAPETIHDVLFTGVDADDGLTDVLMQYVVGDQLGLDAVAKTTATNPLSPTQGYINTGLNLFFQNDVMFDLENGVVGFAPVPEPAVSALFAGLGGLLLCAWRKVAARRK